jgi:transcriptional regulator with XRE-family HTH domain
VEQSLINQRVTGIILDYVSTQKLSDRAFAAKVGVAHNMLGKFREGSAMTLDTLEKIIDTYPELRVPISEVFYRKPTAATKRDEATVNRDREELYKDLETFREIAKNLSVQVMVRNQSKAVEQG